MTLTLDALLAQAEARLGSRKAVMQDLNVSRQRLYSASHDGPPLRAERLIRLAILADVTPGEALRVGGQTRLADLLDQALRNHMPETTMPQRAALRQLADLVMAVQRTMDELRRTMVVDGTDSAGTTEASS